MRDKNTVHVNRIGDLKGEDDIGEEEGIASKEGEGIDKLVADLSVANGFLASDDVGHISESSPRESSESRSGWMETERKVLEKMGLSREVGILNESKRGEEEAEVEIGDKSDSRVVGDREKEPAKANDGEDEARAHGIAPVENVRN